MYSVECVVVFGVGCVVVFGGVSVVNGAEVELCGRPASLAGSV